MLYRFHFIILVKTTKVWYNNKEKVKKMNENKKNKKTILVTVSILIILFLALSIVSLKLINDNNKLKEGKIDIVISQMQGETIVEVYRAAFSNDLNYQHIYESNINPGKANTVIIKNGECYIIDSTCPNHTCEDYRLTNKKGIFNSSSTITCLPNGLYISIETSKE